MATIRGACGFGVETPAMTKNACDTVVAAFFEVHHHCYRDAFHPKARSPRLITLAYRGWVLAGNLEFGGRRSEVGIRNVPSSLP